MRPQAAEQSAGGGRSSRKARITGAAAGLGFTILYLVGNSGVASLPGAPTGSESDDELARYLSENRGAVLLFAAMVVLSAPLLAWFAYALRSHLLAVGGARASVAGEVVVAAGVAASSMIVCATAVLISAAVRSSEAVLPPDTARTLWDLSNGIGLLFVLPAAALTGAVALVARRTSSPRWVRLSAPAVALLLIFIFVAWLSIKVWCVWLMVLSVSVLRGRAWSS